MFYTRHHTAVGLSNDCKWVFNEPLLTLWCHAVVHFEVIFQLVFGKIVLMFKTITSLS